jgi:hypothetical protein
MKKDNSLDKNNISTISIKDDGKKLNESVHHHPVICYICLDTYSSIKRPMILVCGHTFCELCLQNLFDTSNEILCSFCKVITRLEKFEDMIINYSIMSLAEQNPSGIVKIEIPAKQEKLSQLSDSNSNFCPCSLTESNNNTRQIPPDKIETFLRCSDCEKIVCSQCISMGNSGNSNHNSHKMMNFVDFITQEAHMLSENLKSYRELANKMTILYKKVDKSEIERIVKSEKENVLKIFRQLKVSIEKNQEIVLNCLDKFQRDAYNSLDNFKKELKYFNQDSTRYSAIVEEFCGFKNFSSKQKAKILNIYNLKSTLEEIKDFNKEVSEKSNRIMTPDVFFKKFVETLKNISIYRNKIEKFHALIQKKLMNVVETGFDKKIKFYNKKRVK